MEEDWETPVGIQLGHLALIVLDAAGGELLLVQTGEWQYGRFTGSRRGLDKNPSAETVWHASGTLSVSDTLPPQTDCHKSPLLSNISFFMWGLEMGRDRFGNWHADAHLPINLIIYLEKTSKCLSPISTNYLVMTYFSCYLSFTASWIEILFWDFLVDFNTIYNYAETTGNYILTNKNIYKNNYRSTFLQSVF